MLGRGVVFAWHAWRLPLAAGRHHRRRRRTTSPSAASSAPTAALSGAFGRGRSSSSGRLRFNARLVSFRRWKLGDRALDRRRYLYGLAGRVRDDALERARAALVELDPAGERLDAHLQVLGLDAQPRRFEDEVVNQLVIQLIEVMARRFPLGVDRVQLRLDVQRLNQRVRVEEQLQDRLQQPAEPADGAAVRLEKRVFAKRVVGPRGRRSGAAELVEEIGADAAWVEEFFELDRSQLLDLR